LLTAALASSALSCAGKAKVEAKAAVSTPSDEDGDGIPDDGTDKCLKEKEDGLPPDSKDGCLSTDADGDGIADDGSDHCRDEKEDGLPPEPKDGCKTKDPDNDGVLGKADKCPEEAETNNDYQDEDGCPDKAPRVRVTKSEVKITEKIMFAFGKATIEKESDDLLDEIAYVVNDSPQIEFIEVAGHADKIGTDATNVQLTRARANAVLNALATRKVDRRRMRAAGYGRYCPLDAGDSDAAREKNRRVEFKIMRVDGVDTGVQLGCDESKKHGIHTAGVPAGAPKRAQLEKIREANPPEKPKPSKDPPPKATPPEKKPETKPATKPKPEAKPAAKPEAKPAAKAEAKPVPKPTAAKPAATAAATAQPLAPMPKK
jgi:outer membrane protein OmpA-like peptidoglycan-associated protein